MQYESNAVGRMFTIRLEDGDPVYRSVEEIARRESITRGVFWLVGGVQNGRVVVGPEKEAERPITPMQVFFADSREMLGIGTLFPDEEGKPSLHIHSALGKAGTTITGCPRISLDAWLVTEIILLEMVGGKATRALDENGFHLLGIPLD